MKFVHLRAGIIAALILAALVVGGVAYADWLEHRYANVLAPIIFNQKNQGAAMQQVAFEQANILPLYGASELIVAEPYEYPYRASAVFQSAPTGFRVFPVGWHAAASINMLQKLAAVGPELQGKKVVIIISPPSFFNRVMDSPEAYAGNYSRLQAYALAFSTSLSFDLKHRAAQRMLQYPKTLENDPLLRFALAQLADGSPVSRALYYAAFPLGKFQTLILRLQDHVEMVAYIWQHHQMRPKVAHARQRLDWQDILDKAQAVFQQHSDNNPFGFDNDMWTRRVGRLAAHAQDSRHDAQFLSGLQKSKEWGDLDLLLRELQELGAQPLILSAPLDGPYYDYLGVSYQARTAYYAKLRAAVQPYGVALRDFEDHDADRDFFLDSTSHLSAVGWAYYDQAIDAFYHGSLAEAKRN